MEDGTGAPGIYPAPQLVQGATLPFGGERNDQVSVSILVCFSTETVSYRCRFLGF